MNMNVDVCPYVCAYYKFIMHLYVLYDNVQCCEDTVSEELRYIHQVYYHYFFESDEV